MWIYSIYREFSNEKDGDITMKKIFVCILVLSSSLLKAEDEVGCVCMLEAPFWLDYVVRFAQEWGPHTLPDNSRMMYEIEHANEPQCDSRPQECDHERD